MRRVPCVMCHESHVMCHQSCVTCHMSCVTCHMSTKNLKKLKKNIYTSEIIGQSGGASWWMVCYQRGLPRLVLLAASQMWLQKNLSGWKHVFSVSTSVQPCWMEEGWIDWGFMIPSWRKRRWHKFQFSEVRCPGNHFSCENHLKEISEIQFSLSGFKDCLVNLVGVRLLVDLDLSCLI